MHPTTVKRATRRDSAARRTAPSVLVPGFGPTLTSGSLAGDQAAARVAAPTIHREFTRLHAGKRATTSPANPRRRSGRRFEGRRPSTAGTTERSGVGESRRCHRLRGLSGESGFVKMDRAPTGRGALENHADPEGRLVQGGA